MLDGKIAAASGDKAAAADDYRKAIALQDQLNYDEPRDRYYPVRETLGAALFIDGDITGVEAVFRADLERNPHNGRSLYGLSQALEAGRKPLNRPGCNRGSKPPGTRLTCSLTWQNTDAAVYERTGTLTRFRPTATVPRCAECALLF